MKENNVKKPASLDQPTNSNNTYMSYFCGKNLGARPP